MLVPQNALAHLCTHAAWELETRNEANYGTSYVRSIGQSQAQQQIRQEILTAERAEVIGPRDQDCADDGTLGELELDLEQGCRPEVRWVRNEFGS